MSSLRRPPVDPPGLVDLLGRGHATIPQLLEARVARSRDQPFLRWEEQRWTYGEAFEEVRTFAGWAGSIDRDGPADGRRIASFLPNGPRAVWTWLGALHGGATYVPLNRSHRGDLLVDMLVRGAADILVTDRDGLGLLPDLSATSVRTVLLVDDDVETVGARGDAPTVVGWDAVAGSAPVDAAATADATDTAVLMYTSGTTGRSKAVMMPHGQFTRGAAWVSWSLEMGEHDVMHAWLPLYHVAGQLDQVLSAVVAGGQVDLHPTFSRSRFWDQVHASGATIFIGFSNILELIWTLPPHPDDATVPLRAGIMGGIPANLHAPFEERFGVLLNDVYGMTEAEPLVLPHPGERPPVGSMGRPNPDFEVVVLDAADRPCDAGQAGELGFRARVPAVMLNGYEHDEDALAAVSANGWFHTGDLARVDEDGFLFFVDRRKHAIRRRGENISSFELESIVLRHPQVAECSAVGVPSPLGEEDVKLTVVAEPATTIEPAELRAWCVDRMAPFMLPRYIELRSELPRTPTGKVLKERLRELTAGIWDAEEVGADGA